MVINRWAVVRSMPAASMVVIQHDALRQTPADAYTKERARLCMHLFGAVTLLLRDIENRLRQ